MQNSNFFPLFGDGEDLGLPGAPRHDPDKLCGDVRPGIPGQALHTVVVVVELLQGSDLDLVQLCGGMGSGLLWELELEQDQFGAEPQRQQVLGVDVGWRGRAVSEELHAEHAIGDRNSEPGVLLGRFVGGRRQLHDFERD